MTPRLVFHPDAMVLAVQRRAAAFPVVCEEIRQAVVRSMKPTPSWSSPVSIIGAIQRSGGTARDAR
jgi:hypothetical protein